MTDVTGLDKVTGQDIFFRVRCTSFHIHSPLFTFFLCFIVLFQSCCTHVQVFGKTLVHEFPFSIAILNVTCSLRTPILLCGEVPAIKQLIYKQTKHLNYLGFWSFVLSFKLPRNTTTLTLIICIYTPPMKGTLQQYLLNYALHLGARLLCTTLQICIVLNRTQIYRVRLLFYHCSVRVKFYFVAK